MTSRAANISTERQLSHVILCPNAATVTSQPRLPYWRSPISQSHIAEGLAMVVIYYLWYVHFTHRYANIVKHLRQRHVPVC